LMRSRLVEVHDIRLEKPGELLLLEDEEVIQAFSPHASQEAFTDGIRSRSSVWRAKHLDASCYCHACKTRSELVVSISNQISWPFSIGSRLPQRYAPPRHRWENALHSYG
jgi:hypothetical protein